MSDKLILEIDENLISLAKKLAKKEGLSISELISNYLKDLDQAKNQDELSPKVKKLKGIVPVGKTFDFKKELENQKLKKYV
jgi:predicted DNA-binding protein